MKISKPILLIEDDIVDQLIVKRALKDIGYTSPLFVANNGEEGLSYLKNIENERPAIILLDINMPKMNGIEMLKILKSDEQLKRIPVVMLTTSREQQDRINTFNLSVAGYMVKPVEYEHFVSIMKTLCTYWEFSELAN